MKNVAQATAPEVQEQRWHRLTALDGAFLAIEDERNLMHIGATTLFEAGSWLDAQGRIDEARFLRYAETVVRRVPKWRQRLARVPLFRHPVLISDPEFDLARHIRFIHLKDASLRDVERVAADVYSVMLEREDPLWELVVVDGIAGRRFATIIKIHHCMADGISGLGALMALLAPTPQDALPEPPVGPLPEPPSRYELLQAELRWRVSEPKVLWQRLQKATHDLERVRQTARSALGGFWSAARLCSRPAPSTPLNPRSIGSKRAYYGVRVELDQVKSVRRAAGVKLNDVVLATVAGALYRYFEALGKPPKARELRCMVPVSLHQSGSFDLFGNEVSLMIVPLPIGCMQPRERLERIVDWTRRAKFEGQSSAFALGERLAEWTAAPLIPLAMRAVIRLRPYNLIVTNVPGPPVPFYMGDAKLIGIYPMVPLYGNQALGIALVSYNGALFIGLNADPDKLHDLPELGRAISKAFAELHAAYFPVEPRPSLEPLRA